MEDLVHFMELSVSRCHTQSRGAITNEYRLIHCAALLAYYAKRVITPHPAVI